MPFGLRNAPSTFQRTMNAVLEGLVDQICVVYMDDILVYSKDVIDHQQHLRLVLQRLREYGLICNTKKSKFYCTEIEYMGFKIRKNSVLPGEEKISVIKDWQTPSSVTEVRSFLGLLNYYRRFVRDFTNLALPLLQLTKKEKEFHWDESCQKSFLSLKEALISAPVLIMPNFELDFHVWPDASKVALGGILTQLVDDCHHPIAYLSKKLSDTESRYSTTERELYAILTCLKQWRCYWDGSTIVVHTDHKPLTWAKGLKDPKPRVWNWLEEIEYFSPQMIFVPGVRQPADSLSRLPVSKDMVSTLEDKAPSGVDLLRSASSDCLVGHAEDTGEHILDCKNNCYTNISINSFVVEGVTYPDDDWPLLCGLHLLDRQLPLELSVEQLEMIQEESNNFEFKGNVLMRKIKRDGKVTFLPFVLTSNRLEKIQKYHSLLGHLGSESTYKILKDRCWWPDLKDDVYSFITNCRQCQLSTAPRQLSAPFHPIPPAPLPFERWGIDFLQELTPTDQGNKNVLVFVDYATRWPVIVATKDRKSSTVYREFIKLIVNNYGIPDSVISDRAKSFIGGRFGKYLEKNHVKHILTSSYHPRTNGMTERLNRVLKDMIRKFCDGFPEKWDKVLDQACFALRVRIHSVTQKSPFYLLYGRNPRLPGDDPPDELFDFESEIGRNEFSIRELESLGQARAGALWRSQMQARKMIEQQEVREETQIDVFVPGTFVKKKNHTKESLDYPWTGPYVVVEVLPNSLYRIMGVDGNCYLL